MLASAWALAMLLGALVVLCILGVVNGLNAVMDRASRVSVARRNARRREQEKFFTQWKDGAL